MPEDTLEKLCNSIDRKRSGYVELLREAVAIPSITGSKTEARKMLLWAQSQLKDLGASITFQHAGETTVQGKKVSLPSILTANFKSEGAKITLLVYAHLDVRPATGTKYSDEDPFALVEKNGALFGRGVTDSKGPFLCWVNALQAYRQLGVEIPINIRFLIETMKESGSQGLMDYLETNKLSIFQNVNYVCVSDSTCLATAKPVITFGLRGCCKFNITVECGETNLHSGVHGGTVHEPMTDITTLLSSLINPKGEILIPNFREHVEEVTPDEEKAYHAATFDVLAYKASIGVKKLIHKEDKKRLLMHRTRFPSLTVHGIDVGDECHEDSIPCKATAKITIRTVPHQTPEEVHQKVKDYLNSIFNAIKSPNILSIEMTVAIPPWIAKTDDGNYKAAKKAVRRIYKEDAELIREGSSIPIIADLKELSGRSVLLLPVGCSDHGIHRNREKMDVKTFMDGTKLVAAYIYELASLNDI